MNSCRRQLTICKEDISDFKNGFYETHIYIHFTCIKHISEDTKYSEIDSLLLGAYESDQKIRTESMTLMNKLHSAGANDVPVSVIDSLMLLQEQTQAIEMPKG